MKTPGLSALALAALALVAAPQADAQLGAGATNLTANKPLSPRPPMGFNTWNAFGCDIDERKVLANADLMVARGYVAAGYNYFNIDDCWMADARNPATGELVPHPTRFPRGIAFIADYVHARGMKLGIYSSAGWGTCEKRPGSLDHEDIDARTFARWKVDLLKYDNCNNDDRPPRPRFTAMANALKKYAPKDRPIVYAMCAWGDYREWTWAWQIADYWRVSHDICRSFSVDCGWFKSVTGIIDIMAPLSAYQGPTRGWNDADMLQVGNPGLNAAENRAHFGMWAALKSPLIIGTDLRTISPANEAILLNGEVIAINQDARGKTVTRISAAGGREVWAGPLAGAKPSCVVALLNRDGVARWMAVDFAAIAGSLGLTKAQVADGRRFSIRDVFAKKDLQARWSGRTVFRGPPKVDAHGLALLRITQVS
ncbi:glycoside hydrolase superfamily [Hyaloraphidium curvatum]|nr:glycoside hydrolase superfamily [Hyaloraphidium curvatum]